MGFVKIDRELRNWCWYTKPNMLNVWIEILLSAAYVDTYYDGRLIKKGQAIIGRKKMAEKLCLTEQQVRTCINRLKSTNEITIENTNKYSVITIVKWADYQESNILSNQQNNQAFNQQVTNEQPTSNQQVTTIKEIKELKEVLEKDKDLLSSESSELFDLFETEFKRPITQREVMLLAKWKEDYDWQLIRYALREAIIYQKISFDYINGILIKWELDKKTAEQIENENGGS